MQVFNDGICQIGAVVNIAAPGHKSKIEVKEKYVLRFEERTVGFNRYFTAQQANNAKITMVIRVQRVPNISNQDIVTINGIQYAIIQIQSLKGVKPRCLDLSLERIEQKHERD